MTIAGILANRTGEIYTVAPDEALRNAIRIMAEKRIGALPVVEDGRVVGIISERDLIYKGAEHGADVINWPISMVMSSPAITVTSDTSILQGLALMTKRRIRHLPVVENGKLIGFVSIGDLVKRRMDKIESEAEAMLAYIQTV